jgi:hypothetical protein
LTKNTQGRILYELINKWIWYKKYHFRICRGEILKDLSWKEIENHKYEEEATPTSNELCDTHAIFSMNAQNFINMINIHNYKKTNFRKPQPYILNFNSSIFRLEKDFVNKLKPQDVGYLYNNFYEIDMSQVDVEIYLEFENYLSPLCKLNNFLDITKFEKAIFDITQTDGDLHYIWVIIHHR